MNTNAAAFAFILQQRRDLSASQSQSNNTSSQQRQPNYQGNASRPSTGNIPCATPQYQQYTSAPYQQDVYSNQQSQQTHSYSVPQINQGQSYSQYSQSVYLPPQYGWQPQYQQQQQHQQAYPGAAGCYQPSSSSLPQYSVPALPFQSLPIENSYLNQGYQYPYNTQMQPLPSHFKNTIASTLTALPGINNQYRQQIQNNKSLLTGLGTLNNSMKNSIDGVDMSVKNTEPLQLFYCEGCEKEFTQKSAYDAHCANHETCRHPGCTFSGTKKVVIAHFHGSHGLYSGEGYKMIEVEGSSKKYRVLLGVSPVEIEKWRMDRRKNFPTTENTLKKIEQKEELRKAGGLVIEKGKKRKRNEIEQNKKGSNDNGDKSSPDLNSNSNNADSGNKEDENGVIDVANGEKNNENENENKGDQEFKLRKKPCVFFVKGTCKQGDLCTYSHDFEIKVCNFFVRSGRCTRGNKCTFSHDKEERAKFLEERKLNGDKKTSKSDSESGAGNDGDDDIEGRQKDTDREKKINKLSRNQDKNGRKDKDKEVNDDVLRQKAMKKKGQLFLPKPYAGGSRGTLLRNLLLHEVEVEENILLQCLRLIVSNNYLQPVE